MLFSLLFPSPLHILPSLFLLLPFTPLLPLYILSSLLPFQAKAWISEKMQTASDEAYKDPTNLQAKLQKHKAFEAELSAHKGTIDNIQKVQ